MLFATERPLEKAYQVEKRVLPPLLAQAQEVLKPPVLLKVRRRVEERPEHERPQHHDVPPKPA